MKLRTGPLLLALLAAAPAAGQAPVDYAIAFPNAEHHEAEVEITFRELPAGPLKIRMSRTSPGRYALHEFAKNVYSVRATDESGRELTVTRPDPHQWDVSGHQGTVVFRYTLFGDRADGTYTGIDDTHAHLNMPATFAWARGLEDRPITVAFDAPDDGYTIATQLLPTDEPERFTAPDLQYFMDSPTEIGPLAVRSWEVGAEDEARTIRFTLHHQGSEDELESYVAMVRRVVAEEIAVFGEAPDFEPGYYTFIADYLPWVAGDGMEHRNSTILTSTRPLSTGALGNLGTVSHEFFHAWNVERIRPRSLEPFDFEAANMSRELWFAEGFTQYYTPLFIARAGITDVGDYARSIGGTINAVVNAPGREYFSAVEMSMQAPFVDAAVSIDPTNRINTFISYYTWGAAIGLGLDLTLRERYELTLDGFMRRAWETFGETETPYSMESLRELLGEFTGDAAFADDFFRRYIAGREVVDYRALLEPAGFVLRQAEAEAAWLGDLPLSFPDGAAVLQAGTRVGTPVYAAGLDRGDRILSIDGTTLDSAEALEAVLAAHRPGETLPIVFERRGERFSRQVTLDTDPRIEVVSFEAAGREITPEIRAFREDWLGAHAK